MNLKTSSEVETRTLLEEVCSFDRKGLFDLGHPLLNRIAESFVKASGIGAVQAVSRDAYSIATQGNKVGNNGVIPPPDVSATNKRGLPAGLRGETSNKSLEALVVNTGKEALQWGVAAGIYSGLTYGLKEARGAHDWKNSAVAGAITGATLALTLEDSTHEQVVQCAITGAAISTAANLFKGIF
ncbi:outer envelope pore protein 16-2 chloroplastic-like [Trifolium pratense]|uniref:Outer envelope pore protein 16-2 chloroplastic-like n=2 Tax=Trifolium TaxID=3898 RepID=A0A2K3NHP6_TRIPR|nr:outer envelope pore protein 16-2 chloroplastic-like [Trifolium pratense]